MDILCVKGFSFTEVIMKLEDRVEISELLEEYGRLLTDKQKEITELYCNADMSFGELSTEYGISRQGVRDTLTRAIDSLMAYEKVLGLVARKKQITDILLKVKNGEITAEEGIESISKIMED